MLHLSTSWFWGDGVTVYGLLGQTTVSYVFKYYFYLQVNQIRAITMVGRQGLPPQGIFFYSFMMKAFVTVPSCFHSPRWDKPACPLNFRDVGVATGGATPTCLLPGCKEAEQTAKPTNRSATIPSFPLNGLHAEGHGVRHVVQWKKKKKAIPFISSLSLYCHHIAELVPSPLPPTFTSGYQGLEGLKMETLPRVHTPAVLLGSGWMDGWMNGGPGSSSRRPLQDHQP